MNESNVFELKNPPPFVDALTDPSREEGGKILKEASEIEIEAFPDDYRRLQSYDGRGGAARNGYLPERETTTVISPVKVKARRGPQGKGIPFFFADPTAIPAQDSRHGGADCPAVPERRFHRDFPQASSARTPRAFPRIRYRG